MPTLKIIYSLSAFIFGLSLVMISGLRLSWQSERKFSAPSVLAKETLVTQEATVTAAIKEATPTGEVKAATEVNYYLPYPGILPDHPLYWLKMIRDRVVLWLTQEPVQKFNQLLLYADKRLGATQVLIEGNQVNLGVSTATKGEKYLEQTLSQYQTLKLNNKVTPELEAKLQNALRKHTQVLESLLPKVSDQAKPALEKAIEVSKHGYEVVTQKNK